MKYLSGLSANGICMLCLVIWASACSPDGETFPLGNNFIDDNSRVIFIDTFSLQASTLILDSIPTSNADQILVGHYTDSVFGEVSASHYFRMSHQGPLDTEKEYFFDSLVLILTYNDYLEGDTNQAFPISVHPLLSEIELDEDGLLHNISSFPFHPDPIGVGVVFPTPRASDELRIRLDDALGMHWLDQMATRADPFTDIDLFYDQFPGLVLRPDTTIDAAIAGFKRFPSDLTFSDSVSSSVLRLYYREEDVFTVEKTYDFDLRDPDYRFNQITANRSKTLLAPLQNQREALPEKSTYNQIFLHGGLGIMPRIEFPSLDALHLLGEGSILKAELILEPLPETYSRRTPLPDSLTLIETDRINRMGSLLRNDASSGTNYPFLITDYLYKSETSYRFSITNYAKRVFRESDTEHALSLSLPHAAFYHSVQNLRFGGAQNAAYTLRLELYYAINESE